jgi:hypothetical protein
MCLLDHDTNDTLLDKLACSRDPTDLRSYNADVNVEIFGQFVELGTVRVWLSVSRLSRSRQGPHGVLGAGHCN